MQAYEFDYCDTYESYGSSGVMLENNGLRMFNCDMCIGEKTFIKKNANDSKFRCENCIQNLNQAQMFAAAASMAPNSYILEMPPQSLTTAEVETTQTTPQFSWRWLQFFT